MDPALYERFFAIEEDYWWSRWVRDMVGDHLPPLTPATRVLDLGCGTGVLSRELRDRACVTSLDYVADALGYCRRRGLSRLVQGDGHALPFPNGSFDVVVAADTLEHLRDDAAGARELRRMLAPGGLAIINVPAFQFLWGPHDVANHHFRRYSRGQLRRTLEAAGLRCSTLTYTNMVFFPPTLCVRWLKRLGSATDGGHEILDLSAGMNRLLYTVLGWERRLVRYVNLPVGTSVFAVARAADALP